MQDASFVWGLLLSAVALAATGCAQPEDTEDSAEFEELGVAEQMLCGSSMSVTGGLGAAKPGNTVLLFGCHFGAAPGKVELVFASGSKTLLTIQSWSEQAIGVLIPAGISGVYDELIRYRVTRSDSLSVLSNQAQFTATRETRKLLLSEMATTCDDHGGIDSVCASYAESYLQGSTCSHSGCVWHKETLPGAIPIWDADDHYDVNLHPQFEFESFTLAGKTSGADFPWIFCANVGIGPKPSIADPLTTSIWDSPVGPSTVIQFSTNNDFTGCGSWDSYYFDIVVTGPKGTAANIY